jgi:hypothetical protein
LIIIVIGYQKAQVLKLFFRSISTTFQIVWGLWWNNDRLCDADVTTIEVFYGFSPSLIAFISNKGVSLARVLSFDPVQLIDPRIIWAWYYQLFILNLLLLFNINILLDFFWLIKGMIYQHLINLRGFQCFLRIKELSIPWWNWVILFWSWIPFFYFFHS